MMMFAFTFAAQAQITGTWKTIDDETGKAKSYVTISEADGVYIGKVSKILTEGRQDAVCKKCKGDQKNKPILGLQIIKNLKKVSDTKFAGGKITDPKKGKSYDLVILPSSDGKSLTVKGGYKVMGKMIGRTQKWYRVD